MGQVQGPERCPATMDDGAQRDENFVPAGARRRACNALISESIAVCFEWTGSLTVELVPTCAALFLESLGSGAAVPKGGRPSLAQIRGIRNKIDIFENKFGPAHVSNKANLPRAGTMAAARRHGVPVMPLLAEEEEPAEELPPSRHRSDPVLTPEALRRQAVRAHAARVPSVLFSHRSPSCVAEEESAQLLASGSAASIATDEHSPTVDTVEVCSGSEPCQAVLEEEPEPSMPCPNDSDVGENEASALEPAHSEKVRPGDGLKWCCTNWWRA